MRRIKSIMRGSWPLAIVILMVTIFLAQIEYATYYNYTFQIIGRKGELKVISGSSHVGEAIKIQNGKITIRENQYLYTIKDKGQNFTVEFIMPGGGSFQLIFTDLQRPMLNFIMHPLIYFILVVFQHQMTIYSNY